MNTVSHCHKSEVIRGNKHEFPLGGTTYYETKKATFCGKCGEECDEITACDHCGDAITGDPIRIDGDYLCDKCTAEIRAMNPGVSA